MKYVHALLALSSMCIMYVPKYFKRQKKMTKKKFLEGLVNSGNNVELALLTYHQKCHRLELVVLRLQSNEIHLDENTSHKYTEKEGYVST